MFKKSCDICLKMNRVRGKKIANDSSFEIREFEGISSSKQFFLKNIYWVKAGKSFVLTFTRFFKFAIIKQFSAWWCISTALRKGPVAQLVRAGDS